MSFVRRFCTRLLSAVFRMFVRPLYKGVRTKTSGARKWVISEANFASTTLGQTSNGAGERFASPARPTLPRLPSRPFTSAWCGAAGTGLPALGNPSSPRATAKSKSSGCLANPARPVRQRRQRPDSRRVGNASSSGAVHPRDG